MITNKLENFGKNELEQMEKSIRVARLEGFPESFETEDVEGLLNTQSGCFFFTNITCQVCVLRGEELEIFYSCPNCDFEGVWEDFEEHSEEPDCIAYVEENRQ